MCCKKPEVHERLILGIQFGSNRLHLYTSAFYSLKAICFFWFCFSEFGGPLERNDGKWVKEKHQFEFQKGSILYPPNEDAIKKKVCTYFVHALHV